MAKRKIRLSSDEVLRKKSKIVKDITPSVLQLIDDMAETMYAEEGVGLAAPQVGILKRIVVIDVGEGLIEMINPIIVEERGSKIASEGCLSIPDHSEYVERPEYVRAEALNKDGKSIIVEGTGLMAVAMCHEIDHLDGILYIDKAIPEDELEDEQKED